jgi:hypothetical protein
MTSMPYQTERHQPLKHGTALVIGFFSWRRRLEQDYQCHQLGVHVAGDLSVIQAPTQAQT